MSIEVQTVVWRNSKAEGSALLLLLAIADHAHDDGTGAWPSVPSLAKKCRQGERNTRYLLRKLEELGELKTDVGGGPRGCNAFVIQLDALAEGQSLPPANQRQEGGQTGVDRGATDCPRTIIEPSIKPSDMPPDKNDWDSIPGVLDGVPKPPKENNVPPHSADQARKRIRMAMKRAGQKGPTPDVSDPHFATELLAFSLADKIADACELGVTIPDCVKAARRIVNHKFAKHDGSMATPQDIFDMVGYGIEHGSFKNKKDGMSPYYIESWLRIELSRNPTSPEAPEKEIVLENVVW